MLLILAADRFAATHKCALIRHTPCGVGRVGVGLMANSRRLRRLEGGEKVDGEFVAVVTWDFVSEEVDRRLEQQAAHPVSALR
jgi:hypothetical protein